MSEKKAERVFDENQKDAIHSSINTVVSAGAGSGKTTVLAERFSDLVLNRNCNVDEILTLTFTKKATVEMSARIYKTLCDHKCEQAKDFYKANIKTIDSYCNSVAKMGAHLFGISPDFVQDEKTILAKAESLALPFILKHRDNVAIKALVSTNDYSEVANEIFVEPVFYNASVVSPINLESELEKQKKIIVEKWNEYSVKIQDLTGSLINEVNAYEGNPIKLVTTLKSLLAEDIPEVPVLTELMVEKSESAELEEYLLCVKKVSSVKLPGRVSAQGEIIKEIINELRNVRDIMYSLSNFVYGYTISKQLVPLFEEFQNTINNLKRETGILTYRDISDLAVQTLKLYPELRQIEKEKYKAIMIDEFQDNNQMQKDLLFMLAEKLDRHEKGIPEVSDLCPDKLFFVGDEKQSIYLFRGADVSVFRGLSQDFADGNLSMSTNYRSKQALISSFNTIFGGMEYPSVTAGKCSVQRPSVFYTEEQEKALGKEFPEYEAVYHEVTLSKDAKEAVSVSDPKEMYAPRIHIARYSKDQNSTVYDFVNGDAEAQWIAEKIDEFVNTGVNGKKYRYDEIAILIRSYTVQPLYERTFLNHGIPYNTETVTGLFSDGPVNDIISFLRVCIYQKDTMAYSQLLRSPFINLSAEETNAVLVSSQNPFDENIESILDTNSKGRFLHAKNLFEKIKVALKNEPLTRVITKLWYETGYRYETMWNVKVSMYSKQYDILFELAHQAEKQNVNVSEFIDNILLYQQDSNRLDELDIPNELGNGVHILTIHKSKGLEFPVVFICATDKKGRNDTNSSSVYYSKKFGLTLNTPVSPVLDSGGNYFYNSVKEENKNKKVAELRRLTYVALTRAIDEIYITNGNYSAGKDPVSYLPGGDGQPDTIYHILEPVVSYYENPDCKEQSPFVFENILPYNRLEAASAGGIRNALEEKLSLLKKLTVEEIYDKANVYSKEEVPVKYASPSQLHAPDEETKTDSGEYVPVKNDSNIPYSEINEIVASTIPAWDKTVTDEQPKPRFDFTNFGTIAHAYMEAAVKNEPVFISNKDIVGLENKKEKLEKIKEICSQMQQKFIASELGQKAINSEWHEAEYEFRSKVASKIIKGIIDLVFQNEDGTYTIVDYKTNQEMKPEIYYNQLACYRQAVAQMLGVENASTIKCCLFYLRFGKEVDITQECGKIDVTEIVENSLF